MRGQDDCCVNNLIAATLNSGGNNGGFRTEPGEYIIVQDVRGGTRDKTNHGQGIGIRVGGPCYTLSATEQYGVLAATLTSRFTPNGHGAAGARVEDIPNLIVGYALSGNGRLDATVEDFVVSSPPDSNGVREFTGLPKGMDSPRYRALGNAVTVSVARWIAERIVAHDCECAL